ncbi:hypothetical protein RchiOBHm_Chr3g0451991 [Rosa chinensis]|uniref:Uncharacterized protein n=1 Tax=Rosa chinensis TaxID=74649 RepID=A0A2P6R667_ROSCH|nr:hypothetical protein RchiOBHm_Chr3g0451991 [Rosa chinensis]
MPAMAAVLLGLLLMCGPNSALAASGGRCGGSRSTSSSSRFRSSSSSYRWRSSSGSKSTSSNSDSLNSRATLTSSVLKIQVTPSQNIADAEKCFNKISVEERAKFDEETLVNVNNKKKKSPTSKKDNKFQNEYIVVTLLVATEGEHMLPTMNGRAELKAALMQSLKCFTSKNIIVRKSFITLIINFKLLSVFDGAIHLIFFCSFLYRQLKGTLWTPQQENDVLLEQELLEDYPLLKRF